MPSITLVKCGWDGCLSCNPKKKESEMSTVATVKTVERTKSVVVTEKEYTLKLTEQQAGYLVDLLHAHVAGEVVTDLLTPLGYALASAGARRISARNDNTYNYAGSYARAYAVLKYADDAAREAATGKKKSTVF
jgi:hypothetical protein